MTCILNNDDVGRILMIPVCFLSSNHILIPGHSSYHIFVSVGE